MVFSVSGVLLLGIITFILFRKDGLKVGRNSDAVRKHFSPEKDGGLRSTLLAMRAVRNLKAATSITSKLFSATCSQVLPYLI